MQQVWQILKLGSDVGFVEGGAFAWHRAFAEVISAMQLPRTDMSGAGVAYGSILEPRRG